MYNSRVMQQGDCNSPSIFMRIINYILQAFLGIFIFVYLDNIFIYSDTLEDHIDHIKQVCLKLYEHQLYASAKKSQFFADTSAKKNESLTAIIASWEAWEDMKAEMLPIPPRTNCLNYLHSDFIS